jgi:predicted ArsR family transcriptional regulator
MPKAIFPFSLCKNRAMVDLPLATSSQDPLSQPTRARLFELLGELARPAVTAELAERLRLHPNGVRAHLERMERDGLVARDRVRQPVGRPRDAWTLAPDARPGGRAPRAYGDLVRWLARAMPADPRGQRRTEATGREIGREIAAEGGNVVDGTFELILSNLGFQPQVERRSGDRLAFRLCNCPYRDAVRVNQDVVCTLHRGITRGLLDRLDAKASLEGFVPRDPDQAGCLIELGGIGDPEDDR